jgi:hypothetical protein
MLGKNLQLTPLESRKQLLLVESELNRAQLLNELREFKNEIRGLEVQVEAVGSLISSAAKLAATVSGIGRAFTHRNPDEIKKTSWISSLFKGARMGASMWGALRSNLK